MNVNVKRAVWVALLLACLGLVWFALRGNTPLGEVPMSAAPSVAAKHPSSAAVSAAPSPAATSSTPVPTTSAATTDGSVTSPPVSARSTSPTPTRSAMSSAADPAPASSASAESGSGPAPESRTSSEAPAPSSSSAAPSPADDLLAGPAAPWDEITASPVHVEVRHGGEAVVAAPIELTQLNEASQIDPEPHTVGWYGPPQWSTTPGERSSNPGILAGHVVYYGLKDVFWRLDEVRAGDAVVVTYDDGTQAAFRADADAVSVDKSALTKDPSNAWAWELDSPGNAVTLITCDLVPGTGMAGNAFNNWVVQATRVE